MTASEQHSIGSPFGAPSTAADVLDGIDLTGAGLVTTAATPASASRRPARSVRQGRGWSSRPAGPTTRGSAPRSPVWPGSRSTTSTSVTWPRSPRSPSGSWRPVATSLIAGAAVMAARTHGRAGLGIAVRDQPPRPLCAREPAVARHARGRGARRRAELDVTAVAASAGTTWTSTRLRQVGGVRPVEARERPVRRPPRRPARRAHGVRAFAVNPGWILTPLQRHLAVRRWSTPAGSTPTALRRPVQDRRAGRRHPGVGGDVPDLDGLGGLYCEGPRCRRGGGRGHDWCRRGVPAVGHRPRRGDPPVGAVRGATGGRVLAAP